MNIQAPVPFFFYHYGKEERICMTLTSACNMDGSTVFCPKLVGTSCPSQSRYTCHTSSSKRGDQGSESRKVHGENPVYTRKIYGATVLNIWVI